MIDESVKLGGFKVSGLSVKVRSPFIFFCITSILKYYQRIASYYRLYIQIRASHLTKNYDKLFPCA